LKEAGWDVAVFLYGDAGKLPPDARANYARWVALGRVETLADGWTGLTYAPDVLIDALFGLGLSRPLADDLVDCLWELRDMRPKWKRSEGDDPYDVPQVRTVSIDIQSGFDADTGRLLCDPVDPREDKARSDRWPRFMAYAFRADLTVTFHRAKIGHYLSNLGQLAGRLVVSALDPLTYTDQSWRETDRIRLIVEKGPILQGTDPSTRFLDLPKRSGHKYDQGHALILSGGVGKGGAARLAARGALRIGAGVVTLGVPPAALIENAAQLNAIMLTKLADVAAFLRVLSDTRINVLCIGPGFGTDTRARAMLACALRETGGKRGLVLDADALSMLAVEPALFEMLHPNCVLTPHAGEFARLFPDIAEKLSAQVTTGPAYSKVDATREAAGRAGCVVLFKGPDTVIAAPDGQCSINASLYNRAAPWLATAGSGDVLAGFITGLLARGFDALAAAEAGAWLHTECALRFGPGLIAEDLPEQLPHVFANLGKTTE